MDRVSRSEVESAEPIDGVQLALLAAGEHMNIQQFRIEPGAVVPEHSHQNEQLGYLLRGELTFTVKGDEIVVQAGDSYNLQGNEPHAIENTGERVAEGIDIFSPPRTDPDWAE
ncbi:cupin domain-containing protein [Halodesulfurarchaeum sp.]|uniref:cupin domain-containing protein n=1 Tax=Halodesulfurarchaeum sp. TaxID=1980530 RepID=UPI001BC18F7B|nr:cupin domain-containing protein [Halodesulfurarchaeum sp.]